MTYSIDLCHVNKEQRDAIAEVIWGAPQLTFPQELVGPSVSYFVEHKDGMKTLLNLSILVLHQSRQTWKGLINFFLWF